MTVALSPEPSATTNDTDVFAYLCVDRFLDDPLSARFLKTAIEIGLIERIVLNRPLGRCDLDGPAFDLLMRGLAAANVVRATESGWAATDAFRKAWYFRDLLEAKLEFALLCLPDFLDSFTTLLRDPGAFFSASDLFTIFDYSGCHDLSSSNLHAARRWMRYTTALTRHEAGVCLGLHALDRYRRMLDIGGNSGEFALRACLAHPDLEATVADLPVVCEVGREHVAPYEESARIRFLAGDWLDEVPPGCYDLVCLKSILHDWPEPAVERFLSNAFDALEPGGTLLIFERTRLVERPGFGSLPLLLFFRSFRDPEAYLDLIRATGFASVDFLKVGLDTPFVLITARKGA